MPVIAGISEETKKILSELCHRQRKTQIQWVEERIMYDLSNETVNTCLPVRDYGQSVCSVNCPHHTDCQTINSHYNLLEVKHGLSSMGQSAETEKRKPV